MYSIHYIASGCGTFCGYCNITFHKSDKHCISPVMTSMRIKKCRHDEKVEWIKCAALHSSINAVHKDVLSLIGARVCAIVWQRYFRHILEDDFSPSFSQSRERWRLPLNQRGRESKGEGLFLIRQPTQSPIATVGSG